MLSLFLLSTGINAQVTDQKVIPVSVTLNSILRLNVVSGGNIDFVVNTIQQYEDGIANVGRYDTQFTVASSTDFDVEMYAEDASLVGVDIGGGGANTMSLNNVGYLLSVDGSGADGTNWDIISSITMLTGPGSPASIVAGIANNAAGGTDQNAWTINWELATDNGNGSDMVANTGLGSNLLTQSLTPDRYITNVYLELIPQ